MTPAERITDRIAKNRRSEALRSEVSGPSLDEIVTRLHQGKQRATYKAVAGLVGVLPRGLMSGRPKSQADSWVVAATNGRPTGYTKNQIDPDCYQQIVNRVEGILDTAEDLRRWMDSPPRP
jgi:hypothetical protein